MKITDVARPLLKEGKNHPIIVVDVQPAYSGINSGSEDPTFIEIIKFVHAQTGPVLKFVNAEQDGLTEDTIEYIQEYWEYTICDIDEENEDEPDEECEIDWSRFTIVDKGYGHFRNWMDNGVEPALIIKLIRLLYQEKVNDVRELFGGDDDPDFEDKLEEFAGSEYEDWMVDESFSVNWTSVAQLKRFSGAYLVGGGREECLREVELLMNAFNIKYKRIDSLVYG